MSDSRSWIRPWMVFWATMVVFTVAAALTVDVDHFDAAETIALVVSGVVYLVFQHRHPRRIWPWQVFWSTYLYVTIVGGSIVCLVSRDPYCAEGAGFISGPVGLVVALAMYLRHRDRHPKPARELSPRKRARLPGLGP